MPHPSVLLIRGALLALVAGAGLGAVLLAMPAALPATWWRVHAEVMLLGWCLQAALGVAYWILPRHASGPERGRESVALAVAPCLNLGVVLVVGGLIAPGGQPLVSVGRALELGAVGLFAVGALPRIKPFGAGRR